MLDRGVAYIVAMPGNHVKGTVVLCALEELSAQLVDNLPRLLGDLVLGRRVEEVPCIGESVSTQGSQLREFKLTTPDFKDVTTRRPIRKLYAETDAALDNDNLSRLDEQGTKLGLNVQCTLLGNDGHLTIRVDKSLLGHAGVSSVDVGGQAFPEGWLARASHGLQTRDKVYFAIGWNVKRVPGKLGRGDMDAGVQRKKVGFCVLVIGKVGL